jgi:hypothetical protein
MDVDADGDAEVDADAEGEVEGDTVDDTLYCICRKVSHGEMIGCDNENCEIEWVSLIFLLPFRLLVPLFRVDLDLSP